MRYIFAEYALDTRLYELRYADQLCKIEPQVFNVLLYLLQHRDRVVTKDELLEQLWPNQFISEVTLNHRVMAVRKVIGDSGREQRCIKTLHGRGYRFVAEVVEQQPDIAPTSPQLGVASAVPHTALPPVVAEPRNSMPAVMTAPAWQRCPTCQQDNSVSAQFCMACGTRLGHTCTHCGQQVHLPAMFCPACGQRVADVVPEPPVLLSRTPAVLDSLGDRKPVTVLHIALADIPMVSAPRRLDALHTLMQGLYGLAQREVSRYGGTIHHVASDHIMAVFGVPTVHEDHARRAVLAAFGLRQQASEYAGAAHRGLPLGIRMGLHTGQVAVGGIGNAQESVPTVVGDTALLAAEIQEHAPPGMIVCSDAIARLVAGYCTLRPLHTVILKDHSTSLQTWEVCAVQETRTRLEVEVERGLTPFVGRERELALLLDRFAQAQAGYGQVILVVGEAGIGKSRLLFELRRRLGEEATWLEGHAVSFGQAIALHPMIDLLKRHCQIEESDSESTVISKIEAGVSRLGDTLSPILPYLRYLLSVEPGDPTVRTMDPKLRRVEIYEALRSLLLRPAEIRPQVFVFEDLHWIDQATEELLRVTFDSVPSSRVLWLFTTRPGYTPPFGDRTYLTRITLPALSTTDSIQMAQGLLASDRLPTTLEALIVQKAEGNPFFVEEMLKTLQESDAIRHDGEHYVLTRPFAEITVPDTIQDVLMARIDRLPDPPRQLLQLAAVIGREFSYRLLGRLTDDPEHTESSLQALQAIELIYEKRLFPERVYLFKHALTHEVAYNSMLAPRRRALHCRIGQAIEELYAERMSEQYDVLAYHFARGEAWPQALDYLCKAAAKAAQAFAIREALALYDHALEIADDVGERVDRGLLMDIHQAKANLYYVLSDFERSRLEAECLLTLAREAGDRVREGAALASSAWASTWARDLDRAIISAQQAIDVAQPIGAASVLSRGHFTIGFVRAVIGQHEQAEVEITHALRHSQTAKDVVSRSLALSTAGLLKNWTADYSAAVALQAEGLALAREHQLLIPLLFSFFFYGITLTGQGDYEAALALFQEGLGLAEKVGDEAIHHRLLNCLGWLYSETGNLDEAIDLNRRSAEIGQRRRDPGTRPNAGLNLGEIFLAQGDLTLAHEFLDSIYRYTLDPATSAWMKDRFSIRLYADLGTFWLRRGDLDKATAFADQSLDLATRSSARKNLVKGWRLKGEIAFARRAWQGAASWLQRALTLAQCIGNPPQLWQTHMALEQMHLALRRPEQAQQSRQAARDVIDHVKTRVQTPALRTSLDRVLSHLAR